ncbi:MAG: DegT/DnrJ/EryC1/StrS family aminotransferase [Methanocellales archaeon]|nr:DegT/DnrJ/EryC1/StrS family aminotransferase [Methanocellales archaeon]
MIPLCVPNIDEKEMEMVREVLESGWVAHGPKNEQLERDFAEYIGTKHAITLNSCTSALQLAIQAQGLNGEIILPSFTFVASANSIVTAGCKPVFVDIDYDTCNIDPSKIEEKINDDTVGIMPVHYAGQSCEMDDIMDIAEKHHLVVIEDSAEAIGAEYGGKKTGSFGIGCFSFWATKNMTTGEGGMLTTDDDGLAEQVRTLRGHGISSTTWQRYKERRPWIREAILPGYNYRMSNILAAIGIVQLKKLDEMNEQRRKHAEYLNKRLDFEAIEIPVESKKCKHVYQMYTIKVKVDRAKFVLGLREKGIGASVHFDPPVHLNPYYMNLGYRKGDLPVTEKVSSSIVTLPMYPQLRREELDTIISSVEDVLSDVESKDP